LAAGAGGTGGVGAGDAAELICGARGTEAEMDKKPRQAEDEEKEASRALFEAGNEPHTVDRRETSDWARGYVDGFWHGGALWRPLTRCPPHFF